MAKSKKNRSRAMPTTRLKLNGTAELLHQLGEEHRESIFPNIFQRITFDMVCEVEYHCEVRDRTFRVNESHFWLAPGRPDEAKVPVIYFSDEMACHLGSLFDTEMKRTIGVDNKEFKLGYTKDPTYVQGVTDTQNRVVVLGQVEHKP